LHSSFLRVRSIVYQGLQFMDSVVKEDGEGVLVRLRQFRLRLWRLPCAILLDITLVDEHFLGPQDKIIRDR
jgi:hypothetical protein